MSVVAAVIAENPLNLTPHDVVVSLSGDTTQTVTIKAAGTVARLDSAPQALLGSVYVDGSLVDAYSPQSFTSVLGLEALDATSTRPIIVSSVVAEHMLRTNHPYGGSILTPDSGPQSAVRNDKGQIVAVRRLNLYR